jgi:hypothetical protein
MNNKRLLAVAASACLAVAASSVTAGNFNYTFAELGYRNVDGDDMEADGFRASFSFAATEHFQVVGDYSRLWLDDMDGASSVDVDIDEFKIGFGGHYSFTDKIDGVAQVTYVDDQYTGKAVPDGLGYKKNINTSDEGYEVTMFGRVQATKNFELTPHVVYRDVGSDSDTGLGLGLVYRLNRNFGLRFRATQFSDDDTTNLFAGIRLNM